MPEIALAKVNPEAPLDRACLFACGLSTGLGAALNTAKVEAGSTCVVFGAGHGRAGCGRRLPPGRAPSGSCASTSRRIGSSSPAARGRPTSMVGGEDTVERIVEMTGGFGADYTFEATGNVNVMRQAVEAARMGWGLCTVAGVAGKGETLDVIPRFLITGRRIAGSSFGGVKGRDGVPAFDRPLAGRRHRRRPVRLPPHHAGRREPRLRADGGPGRHPQRDRLRLLAGVQQRGQTPMLQRGDGRTGWRRATLGSDPVVALPASCGGRGRASRRRRTRRPLRAGGQHRRRPGAPAGSRRLRPAAAPARAGRR